MSEASWPKQHVACGARFVGRMEFTEGIGSRRAAAALALVLIAGRVGVVAQVAISERIPATPGGCAPHFDATAWNIKKRLTGGERKGLGGVMW